MVDKSTAERLAPFMLRSETSNVTSRDGKPGQYPWHSTTTAFQSKKLGEKL